MSTESKRTNDKQHSNLSETDAIATKLYSSCLWFGFVWFVFVIRVWVGWHGWLETFLTFPAQLPCECRDSTRDLANVGRLWSVRDFWWSNNWQLVTLVDDTLTGLFIEPLRFRVKSLPGGGVGLFVLLYIFSCFPRPLFIDLLATVGVHGTCKSEVSSSILIWK